MRISISVVSSDVQVSQDFIALEVFEDMSLDAVKGFVQEEIQISSSAQHFVHNGQVISNTSQTLQALGISDGDVLSLMIRTDSSQSQRRPPNNARATAQQGSASRNVPDAETTRLQILADGALQADLRERDPDLLNTVNNPARFAEQYQARMQQASDARREKEEMMALLDSDPFNVEAQAKIEEIIRNERVMENMKKALEDNPESFGRVVMLYIDVTVNNVPIKAFVDSGAQTTIMSPEAAERCGIMRLIDRRYGGIARGVGTAKILGRVHSADIQIGQYNLASSFTVMEGKGVDLLLGLDMLKRHQMCIDLGANALKIQNDAIPFLSENETPRGLEDIEDEPSVPGPGNTEIGATTGTVKPSSGSSSAPQTSSTASSSGIRIHPPGSAGNVLSNPRPTQQQTRPPTDLPTGVTEQAIGQVIDVVGCSRQEAIGALQQAQGNVELAIGVLI